MYKKVVWIIIDALRYDFAKWNQHQNGKDSSFYENHLPILQQLLTTKPNHSRLFQFQADPPTMTMQRLKGLTTGSLPTFLDIKENMHSSKIVEDNWIYQVTRNGNVVFMGDDTWTGLYGSLFKRTYGYDSFLVKDLDTVDNGVQEHLYNEMQKKDWTVLIGHCLGVDHVGHTFGPSDIHMENKLQEMNNMITKIVEELPEETLLIVCGDHGMSPEGNHGGATLDETNAALFVYSSSELEGPSSNAAEIPQVDLVPTISILLGLPIPFGNLGAIIPDFFNDVFSYRALEVNVHQIRNYFKAYTKVARVAALDLEALEKVYEKASSAVRKVQMAEEDVRTEEWKKEAKVYMVEYIREALSIGRRMWTQFDLVGMSHGIILFFLGILLTLSTLSSSITASTLCLGLVVGTVSHVVMPVTDYLPSDKTNRLLVLCTYGAMCSVVATTSHCLSKPTGIKTSTIMLGLICLQHVLALLSNSYIVAEHHVFSFLVSSVGCVLICTSLSSPHCSVWKRAFVFMIAGWLPTQWSTPNVIFTTTSMSLTWLPMIGFMSSCFYYTMQQSGSNFRWGTPLLNFILCCLYWGMDIENNVWLRLGLPRWIYLSTLLAPLTLIVRPTGSTILKYTWLLLMCIPPLLLVHGPTSPLVLGCWTVQFLSIQTCFLSNQMSPFCKAVVVYVVASHGFFSTGHHTSFTALQNGAGFIGMDTFSFYIAGALLAWNTFGVYITTLVVLPLLSTGKDEDEMFRLYHYVLTIFAVNTLVTTIFVAAQRRHLMVWAIFAPKFIYDGLVIVVVCVTLLVSWGLYKCITQRVK